MRSKFWKTKIDTYAKPAMPEPGGLQLGILPGSEARIKNQELKPELSLKFRARDMAFER